MVPGALIMIAAGSERMEQRIVALKALRYCCMLLHSMRDIVKKRNAVFGISQTVLLCVMLPLLPALAGGETIGERFFLRGDGRIHIRNARTGEEARVALLTADGSLNEEAFTRIDAVFGFPTKEKGEHISPRLIFMLDYFSDLVAPGKAINLESGFRSPRYNSKLRNAGGNVARTSTHIDGMALDFNIKGVKGKDLWEIVRSKNCCGVGYYGGKNVHLDSARPRFWEAATSKVRTGESDYNRRIYLATDYDRYRTGDTVRLSFSAVSDFGFGIRRTVVFVDDSGGNDAIATAEIKTRDDTDCVVIRDRETARFIYLTLPANLHEGRYRIRVDFCQRPFDQMPLGTVSNEIELSGRAP
jgi:uncharacterized protein YcbK (DUF882 family)